MSSSNLFPGGLLTGLSYFLNPEIDGNCTNLWNATYYCVQAVGSISTYSGYPGATTTTPIVPDQATDLPAANLTDNYHNTQPIILIANETRVDCSDYIWLNSTTNTSLADCWQLSLTYGITAEQFILWNPSLDANQNSTNGTYDYPCTLSASSSYCVTLAQATAAPMTEDAPTPRAAGEISNCTSWDVASTYFDCSSFLGLYDLTLAQFYAFNPSVNSDCSGLNAGTYYCVSTEEDGGPPPENTSTEFPSTTVTTTTTTSSPTGIVTPTPTQVRPSLFLCSKLTCPSLAWCQTVTNSTTFSPAMAAGPLPTTAASPLTSCTPGTRPSMATVPVSSQIIMSVLASRARRRQQLAAPLCQLLQHLRRLLLRRRIPPIWRLAAPSSITLLMETTATRLRSSLGLRWISSWRGTRMWEIRATALFG